ncbi:calcyphosin-2-like [Mya arenaria]|uniref:calcyphosin-2-like n=1 Tax=Mya arenaria TaxID=6604 RepID=UPI0022E7724B|nr:calcyphosin-2-like [Mya arenaria]
MSFSVTGRPLSGRPGSRQLTSRNPITGEEIVRTPSRADNVPASRQSQKPEGIPGLDLQYLKETSNYVYKPIQVADYPIHGGESARTDVSWGSDVTVRSHRLSERQPSAHSYRSSRPTGMPGLDLREGDRQPTVTQKPTTPRPSKPTAWDAPPVADPDAVPPPSQRHRDMYQQYEREMKDGYRAAANKEFTEEEINAVVAEVRQQHAGESGDGEQDVVDRSWSNRPHTATNTYIRRMDAEELLDHNKKLKLLETVMVDQLSRGVISDPDQNIRAQMTAGRRPRGSNRALHDSKVTTASTATENLLSKRVRFGARVLTRNGHDAIRELTGFFFSIDNSLTIYEFRQFGKSAKALPFISRGRFSHLHGPRKGDPYTLVDICAGSDIAIATKGQSSLPETLKKIAEVTFRVTDVEEEEKRKILLDGVPSHKCDDVYTRLHIPSKQAFTEKMVIKTIQKNVQKKIQKRAIKTITGLGRYYRQTAGTGSGVLYRFELEKGLFDFHIDLPPETLDALFEILDEAETGELDYSVYMWAVIGNMVEARKSLIRKAFRKIDAGKKGYITISDIQKFFNTTFRTNKGGRDAGDRGPLQAFVDAVLPNPKQEEVSYAEFEEYYEGLSLAVTSDDDFFAILKNTWTI